MLNSEGTALLSVLIGMCPAFSLYVEQGDCKSIAAAINGWMPADMQVSPGDVYAAVKNRPDFGGVKMNVEILRARIDAIPILYSARISGDMQAIVNELHTLPDMEQVTAADVIAAMQLRPVPKPVRVASGAAALVGKAQF